jgi:hypothetical protein
MPLQKNGNMENSATRVSRTPFAAIGRSAGIFAGKIRKFSRKSLSGQISSWRGVFDAEVSNPATSNITAAPVYSPRPNKVVNVLRRPSLYQRLSANSYGIAALPLIGASFSASNDLGGNGLDDISFFIFTAFICGLVYAFIHVQSKKEDAVLYLDMKNKWNPRGERRLRFSEGRGFW